MRGSLSKVIEYRNGEISVAKSEDQGIDPLRTAIALQRQWQAHRGLAGLTLSGSASADSERRARQAEANALLATLGKQVGELGYTQAVEQVRAMKTDWERLSQQVDARELKPAESFAAHVALVDRNLKLLDGVADASGLSLDPVAETYYVMTAMVDHLPRAAEAMARIRGEGSLMLAGKAMLASDQAAVTHRLEQARYLQDRSAGQLAKAQDLNPEVKKSITQLSVAAAEAERFYKLTDKEIVAASAPGLAAGEFFKAGTAAVDAQYKLLDESTNVLEGLLHTRIHDVEMARNLLLGLLGGLGLAALGLGVAITRSVTRPLSHAVDVAAAVAEGDLGYAIDANGNDEAAMLPQAPAADAEQPAATQAAGRAAHGRNRSRRPGRQPGGRGDRRGRGQRHAGRLHPPHPRWRARKPSMPTCVASSTS